MKRKVFLMLPFVAVLCGMLIAGMGDVCAVTLESWPSDDANGTEIGHHLGTGFEPSDVLYHKFRGTFFIVDDGGEVAEVNLNGDIINHWYVSGAPDLEGITVIDESSNYIYLGVETPSDKIVEFNISTGALTGKSWNLSSWLTDPGNSGLEALTFVPNGYHPYTNSSSGGLFYAGQQSDGKIYVFDINLSVNGSVSHVTTINPLPGVGDIAGMYYEKSQNIIYAVYDTNNYLIEMTPSGTVLHVYNLPGLDQEGVTVVARDTGYICISEDSGRVMRYSGYPHVAPTVTLTAEAGADKNILIGDTANFDGSSSVGTEGSTLAYAWDFGDGTTGAGVTLSHVYNQLATTYTAKLTVTDGISTATDTVSVIVSGAGSAMATETWPADSGTEIAHDNFIASGLSGFEPSDAVWVGESLFVVSDGGTLAEMDENGGITNSWQITDSPDLEAMTIADENSNFVYLGNEATNTIAEFDVSTGVLTGKSWKINEIGTTGLWALTFVPNGYHPFTASASGGVFYAGSRADGKIYVYDINLSSSGLVSYKGVIIPIAGETELSGLCFDKTTNRLYASFDKDNLLLEMMTNGKVLHKYSLPGETQQGIAIFNKDRGYLFVGEDSTSKVVKYSGYPNVNDAPTLELIGNKEISEGGTLTFTVNAIDPDGDTLSYTVEGLPSGANFINRVFTWIPDSTQAGSYNVIFSVSDGIEIVSETMVISVIDVNAAPQTGIVNPANGTSYANQEVKFITTCSDPDGEGDVKYFLLNISSVQSQKYCLYAYYNRNTNRIYLKNDNASAWLGGYTPGSINIIENSYCSIDCAGTTVSGSGNIFTITWSVKFKGAFLGVKNCFLYVYDKSGATDGWDKAGTFEILNSMPSNSGVSPCSGSIFAGQEKVFSATCSDPDGYSKIKYCYFQINTSTNGKNCFYAYYVRSTNKIYLKVDNTSTYVSGTVGAGMLENSYYSLDLSRTTVSGIGETLTINWAITPKNTAIGAKNIYQYVIDNSGAKDGWDMAGEVTITM